MVRESTTSAFEGVVFLVINLPWRTGSATVSGPSSLAFHQVDDHHSKAEYKADLLTLHEFTVYENCPGGVGAVDGANHLPRSPITHVAG